MSAPSLVEVPHPLFLILQHLPAAFFCLLDKILLFLFHLLAVDRFHMVGLLQAFFETRRNAQKETDNPEYPYGDENEGGQFHAYSIMCNPFEDNDEVILFSLKLNFRVAKSEECVYNRRN